MAITGELAPFGLGRLCLHCRCFYNQNKGVVQQRIQEHYQYVRLDHFNLVNLPPVFLPCPFHTSLPCIRVEYHKRILEPLPRTSARRHYWLDTSWSFLSGVGTPQTLRLSGRNKEPRRWAAELVLRVGMSHRAVAPRRVGHLRWDEQFPD